MKPPVSNKDQVLALRRSYSLREVAAQTGLPLGTVKTICSRSGAFKDNPRHRELFTLPPIQVSKSTSLTIQQLPAQTDVTGDKEIDAVLWLREVIKTGQADLIEKAMEAAKRIKTPLKDLENRYTDYLIANSGGSWIAAFGSFGFSNLEALALGSIKKLTRKNEALARFGTLEGLFTNTQAEQFTVDALRGLKPSKDYGDLNAGQVDTRFQAHPDLMPNTLSDCLHELVYWRDLYWLRSVCDGGDQRREAYARECFAFRCMARIKPKTKPEAVTVFRWLADSERMDDADTEAILLNLIG